MTPARQSLTVVVAVTDAAACAAALAKHRTELEAAFAGVAGLTTACLALLPAVPGAEIDALFLECSFAGALSALLGALFALAEPELLAIYRHCSEFPAAADARAFTEYVSARARRASSSPSSSDSDWAFWRRAVAALAARYYWPSGARPDPDELEARRSAVGMQDWQPGAPLLHVARLPAAARVHVKRALRALEQDPVLDPSARFLVHEQRLLFFSYPAQIAWLWSERVSQSALEPLTRIWATVPEFRPRPWLGRARRSRDLQRFLLDGRAPVAAWFNADAQRPRVA